MKVDNALTPLVGSTVKPAKAGASSTTDKTSAAPQDNVSLATKVEGSAPPFDSARIDAIKQAISEGRFKINPEKIADSLIASAKELVAG